MGTYSRHTAAADVTLPAVNVPGYEITPGYTTQLPGAVLYSEEFDTSLGGWTAGADSRVTRVAYPGTSDTALFIERLGTAGAAIITRSFSGLIVGRKYYATSRQSISGASGTRVMQLPSTPGVIASESGAGSVGYVGVFVATATTQTITLAVNGVPAGGAGVYSPGMYVRGFSLTLLASSFYTPPVMQPPVSVPGGTVALSVKSSSVTLDDAYSPYARATLVCYAPPIEVLEALDPRKSLRVNVTFTQSWGDAGGDWNSFGYRAPVSRTFNLSLRERSVNKKTGEMTLTLASDEGVLIDYALVSTYSDQSPIAMQGSLRSIVNYVLGTVSASLVAGDPDTHVAVSTSPNLIKNPSGRRGTTGYSVSGGSLGQDAGAQTYVLSTTAGAAGTKSLQFASKAIGVDGLEPNTNYVVAVDLLQSGQPVRPFLEVAGAGVVGASKTVGGFDDYAWHRVSVPFTTTAAGAVNFTIYNLTALSSTSFVMAFRDAQLEKSPVATPYFDGAKAADSMYAYAWGGTADNSLSTRTLLTPRSEQILYWMPGQSAWDFLEPIVQATGYRLWCDENRAWHLAKAWNTQTQINVSPSTGLTYGVDQISRNEAWYDSVVVEYRWTDLEGRQQVRWDIAGTSGNSTDKTVYDDTPYPGPGAAAAILRRADGKGRLIAPSSINDYKATPGMVLQVSMPDSPVQTGMLSNVTWNLPEDVMQVGSRALTDTPANAWINALGPWTAATGSWTAAIGTN